MIVIYFFIFFVMAGAAKTCSKIIAKQLLLPLIQLKERQLVSMYAFGKDTYSLIWIRSTQLT
jgi:hypothetical protein